jgi:prepilin-type N-terminal cleavage/methylation domain-containing protein
VNAHAAGTRCSRTPYRYPDARVIADTTEPNGMPDRLDGPTMTTQDAATRAGFTIVELLVVIGIMGVLAGILLPALAGAMGKAQKTEELNRIRQVGIAWNLYATKNNDAALPGYLDEDTSTGDTVQSQWRVRFLFPDSTVVSEREAAPWPFRLMPYLDYDIDTVLGYRTLDEMSKLSMSNIDIEDPAYNTASAVYNQVTRRPETIAQQPAFGYNALYVGGWWEMTDVNGQMLPRPRFASVREVGENGVEGRVSVVAASPSAIRNSSDFVVFCSSSEHEPGQLYQIDDERPGAHYVVPPIVAAQERWRRARIGNNRQSSVTTDLLIEVLQQSPVPVGRYNELASVLHADLHTTSTEPGSLVDQRLWINAADRRDFKHTNN